VKQEGGGGGTAAAAGRGKVVDDGDSEGVGELIKEVR
jgi:hypothetical protein